MTREQFIIRWRQHGQGRCFYCGIGMQPSNAIGKGRALARTKEHVYPKWMYPGLHKNTVMACYGCNHKKGEYTPEEFRRQHNEKIFYCERVLGESIPPVNGHLLQALYAIVDRSFDTLKNDSKQRWHRQRKNLQDELERIRCLNASLS